MFRFCAACLKGERSQTDGRMFSFSFYFIILFYFVSLNVSFLIYETRSCLAFLGIIFQLVRISRPYKLLLHHCIRLIFFITRRSKYLIITYHLFMQKSKKDRQRNCRFYTDWWGFLKLSFPVLDENSLGFYIRISLISKHSGLVWICPFLFWVWIF